LERGHHGIIHVIDSAAAILARARDFEQIWGGLYGHHPDVAHRWQVLTVVVLVDYDT